MASSRESLIKLAGLASSVGLVWTTKHYGLEEASVAGALLSAISHASFGHMALDFIHDLAHRFSGGHPARHRENQDLHRLIGETIARILDQAAETNAPFARAWLQDAVVAFRGEAWMNVELKGAAKAVSEPAISRFFSGDPDILKSTTVLDHEEWIALVEDVLAPTRTAESEAALGYAAAQLRDRFAFELWESIKHAWEKRDLAWPALMLRLLSEILGQSAGAAHNSAELLRDFQALRSQIVRHAEPAMSAAGSDPVLVQAIREEASKLETRLDAVRDDIARLERKIDSLAPYPLLIEPAVAGGAHDARGATRTDSQVDIPPARLLIVRGPIPAQKFTIDRTPMVIGRSAASNIVLSAEYISDTHAELSFAQGQFYLTDKRSKNGTRLISEVGGKEERLLPCDPRPLKPGSRFRVGRVVMELELAEAEVVSV